MTFDPPAPPALGDLTSTERAVLGDTTPAAVLVGFDAYARERLGSPIEQVRFRSGRIDVVWGVQLADGRAVVIKSHRLPTDVDELSVAVEAKRHLFSAGFPCPQALAGPDRVGRQLLTAETLLAGPIPDGHVPANRRLLAEGLARHIAILRDRPDLIARTGRGPSWCHYRNGPWPVPHDPIVDFTTTPESYAWLDAFARRCSDQILRYRGDDVVAGHADWYAGNTAVVDGSLVGSFDWELVADTEAVIAGFTAACYAASSTSGGGMSTPEDAAAFLIDYDAVRGVESSPDEQRTAAGATAWIMAFNARWQVGMGSHGEDPVSALALVRDRPEDYLSLRW